MKSKRFRLDDGFTLIEVIITLVFVGILAGMIVVYFGSAITGSPLPLTRLNAEGGLNEVMEKVTAQYSAIPHWNASTAYVTGNIVIPTPPNANTYQYICTTAGTSGSSEPGWQTATTPFTDGTVQWKQNGPAPTLVNLQTSIGAAGGGEGQNYANTFGSYYLIRNRFITFNSSYTEVADTGTDNTYLKVTIGHSHPLNTTTQTAETLTTVFVKR
jgi:prepilin-type N-terminal cleavage/methylation domain-containing protein